MHSLDSESRAHVEGTPCYMYGIRAPDDDDLPVAGQPATDAPEDVRRIARMCITTDDIADAILAERKRCANIVRDEKPYWCGDEHDGGREVACERILEAIETGQ